MKILSPTDGRCAQEEKYAFARGHDSRVVLLLSTSQNVLWDDVDISFDSKIGIFYLRLNDWHGYGYCCALMLTTCRLGTAIGDISSALAGVAAVRPSWGPRGLAS